jgi:hypothetical protein
MNSLFRGAVVLALLACAACTPTEPRSAIVEHADKAGSGEPTGRNLAIDSAVAWTESAGRG